MIVKKSRAGMLLALVLQSPAPGNAQTVHGTPPEPGEDTHYAGSGSWNQTYRDQWGLWRVGLSPRGTGDSAWDVETGERNPVVVAVIDTGLDYHHPDLRPQNVWRNPGEIPNGRDDDGNGYIDDLIGWNFVEEDNNPWDNAGHGTHVAGVIGAATGNGEGIAGINRGVRLMPLKVLNFLGRGRSTGIAEAIFYAVEKGARIINLSLGGQHLSTAEGLAVDFAHERGLIVVVAAGNEGADVIDHGPAGAANVLTVAATDPDDRRAPFSNWGSGVDLAAPGVDILSLRARRTDFVLLSGAPDYQPGEAFVGTENRYIRATGTSFAAPFVTGVASLIWAQRPSLTNTQVERMLLMSADDVEVPGWDQYTGAGRLNAAAALRADPDWFLWAKITSVLPARTATGTAVEVRGSVQGSRLAEYAVELGRGESPSAWTTLETVTGRPVQDGVLASVATSRFSARGVWTVRVVARDLGGERREARGTIRVQ